MGTDKVGGRSVTRWTRGGTRPIPLKQLVRRYEVDGLFLKQDDSVDMTTADYAFIVSLLAVVISLFALLWNVWQKFIFVKPELQVSFGIFQVFLPTVGDKMTPSGQRLLNLSATNMGPGPVTIYMCVGRGKRRWLKRPSLGMLNPIHGDPTSSAPTSQGPFSAGLPAKIDAGEMKSFYFPFTRESFLADELGRIGVVDTYGRYRWCPPVQMRKVMRE